MWPFKKKVMPMLPRYNITRDGHGNYRVSAGPGYCHEWDDLAWMAVSIHFKEKTFANQAQTEKAIADFEQKLILDVRQVVAQVF